MHAQAEAYRRFLALHQREGAFVMPNAWDGASAALLAREGFEAIGSSSIAIAFAAGLLDGVHAISREDAVANATLLARCSGLPINGDLEDGFGPSGADCAATVEAAIAGGLAGLGIEDTTADAAQPIHAFDAAVERMRAAVAAARGRIVLTGRTDNFLQGRPDLDDTVRRLVAFAELGADVLYAPGLPTLDAIRTVVRAVAPKPVNVVIGPTGPGSALVSVAELAACGVKRISLGGGIYRQAMATVVSAARALLAGDMTSAMKGAISSKEIAALLTKV